MSRASTPIIGTNASVVERVEAVRNRLGLSAAAFAARAGLNPRSYHSTVSRGGSFRAETISAIAHAHGVSVHWLLTGEADSPAAPEPTSDPLVLRQAARITALLEQVERMEQVSHEEHEVLKLWRKLGPTQRKIVLDMLHSGALERRKALPPMLNESRDG